MSEARTPSRVGRFPLRRELGRGGVGVVYQAHDPDRQRDVAIKVLLAGEFASPVDTERFLREARATAVLDHPNLVRVSEVGWAEERPYLVMDLVEGPSLDERLRSGERFGALAAAVLGRDLARALEHAHRAGIVHRDVKPQNVLFDPDGRPRLTDFGMAAEIRGTASRLTQTGQLLGTPAYLPPEATRSAPAAPTADVYSLGAVLWHVLAGRPPYDGDNPVEVVYAVVEGPPPPLRTVAPAVPRTLAAIVEAAMAREPENRYPSAGALADDLEAFAVGRTVRPPQVPWSAVLVGWARDRARWLGPAAVVAGTAPLLWGTAEWWRADQARRAAQDAEDEAATALAAIGTAHRRELLLALVEDPRAQGTQAASAAWLELGTTEADPEVATRYLARAYATGGPARQDDALRALADRFAAEWRMTSLEATLDLLDRLRGDATGTAAQRADTALYRLDFAAAAPLLQSVDRPGADLARRWARATRGGPAGPAGQVVDDDGDGTLEWWHPIGASLLRTTLRSPFATTRLALPDRVWTFDVLPGDPTWLVSSAGDPPHTVEIRELGGTRTFSFAEDPHTDALRIGDAVWIAIGAYGRRVRGFVPDDGFRELRPVPSVDALGSDVMALARADLGPELRGALVVATGAWAAYDLRVYDALAPTGPLWRQKHGWVPQIVVQPRPDGDSVWTLRDDTWPSQVVFPADRPSGGPAGITEWRWIDGGLAPVRFLEAPGRGRRTLRDLVVADLDGDGAVDPAVGLTLEDGRQVTAVWPGGAPETAPWLLGEVSPLFAADLDPAPGAELAVRSASGVEPTWWILGSGADHLPVAPGRLAARPSPTGLDAARARLWRRAEDMVAMGLLEDAAEELERIRGGAGRAAELWAERGEDDRAVAASWAAAREEPSAERYDEAVTALRRHHRFADASAAAAEGGRPEDPALARVVRGLAEVAVPVGPGFPGAADLLRPSQVRSDDEGTRLDVISGSGELLRWPLAYEGDEITLDVDLEATRTEWGSGIELRLDLPDTTARIRLTTWGGGGLLRRVVECGLGDGPFTVHLDDAPPGPDAPVPVRVRLSASTLEGTWRCRVELGPRVEWFGGRLTTPLAAGDVTLAVGPTDHAYTPGMLATVTLRRLAVEGMGARDASAGRSTEPSPIVRAMLAQDPLALQAAAGAATDGDRVSLLRTHLDRVGPALRAADPVRYLDWFEAAWGTVFHAHPDDPAAVAAWLSEAEGAEDWLRGPSAVPAARALLRRARAWTRSRQLSPAERDLGRALGVLDPATARREGLDLEVAVTLVEWAEQARAGSDRRAAAALETARTYVAPELVDDLWNARTPAASP